MAEGLLVTAFFISYIITPKVLVMLQEGGMARGNFQGRLIPNCAGIIFTAVLSFTYLLFSFSGKLGIEGYTYLGFLALISLAGLVDDAVGNRTHSGFTGHFGILLRDGTVTTGVWKAGLGGIVAVLASTLISISWIDVLLNGALIALTTNFFNLLDVRPGRSSKVFLFCFLVITLIIPSRTADILLFPLAGAVAGYFLYDLRGQAMMGDTGSNVIGLGVGLSLVSGASTSARGVVIAVLVALHFLSEYVSFSKIIEKQKVLHYLDRLGRRD